MIAAMTYPIRVRWNKLFEDGSLIGISVPCEIGFPTEGAARYFSERLSSKRLHVDCVTGDHWKVDGAVTVEGAAQ